MYSVTPAAAAAWQGLFLGVAERAGEPLELLDYPAPAPLSELWDRPDKGAVFMCGLPYSRSRPRPHLLAAPLPSPAEFRGRPEYWSEFVVRADSEHHALSDTFGGRIALTSMDSQSGFAAPLRHLREHGAARSLFAALIAPQITPQGALAAVADGKADVAAVDAYSLRLLQRYQPGLAARVRVVERTEPRPISPLVASEPQAPLAAAFLVARKDAGGAAALSDLLLAGFAVASPGDYDVLSDEFDSTLQYWRRHALAAEVHPAYQRIFAA